MQQSDADRHIPSEGAVPYRRLWSATFLGFGAFGMGAGLYGLVSLIGLVLWVVLMVKAYQGQMFEVPVAAGIAKSFVGK